MKNNIIFVGNKNVGKTTFFNNITKSTEPVGNADGITTNKKHFHDNKNNVTYIDLPGINALSTHSDDEEIFMNELINLDFSKILFFLSAENIIKSSYLLIDVLEMRKPTEFVITHSDYINNVDEIVNAIQNVTPYKTYISTKNNIFKESTNFIQDASPNDFKLDYGQSIEELIKIVSDKIKLSKKFDLRFVAIQTLLKNENIKKMISNYDDVSLLVNDIVDKYNANNKTELSQKIYLVRKWHVEKKIREINSYNEIDQIENKFSDKIDSILTSRFFGIIILFAILILIYYLSINVIGITLQELWNNLLDNGITPIVNNIIKSITSYEFVIDFVDNGILFPLGVLIGFLPMIVSIYVFSSIIELTGYSTRIVILLDRLLSRFGISGRSIMPLINAFGCNVPAIISTRVIPSKVERIITSMIIPLIPCSARFPVTALVVSAFFTKWQFIIVILVNVFCCVVALVSAKIFSKTLFKGNGQLRIIEIPKFKLPQVKYVIKLSLKISWYYINKIFTILFIGSMVVWVVSNFGIHGYHNGSTILYDISNLFAGIFKPLGFGRPEYFSLLSVGILVKELVLTSIPTIFHNSNITEILETTLTKGSAFAFIIFSMLYIPCLSTLYTLWNEFKEKKVIFIAITYSFVVAYICAFVVKLIVDLIT